MKGTALKSFVATVKGQKIRASEGDEVEIPKGVDWVQAGLVDPIKTARVRTESAAIEAPEKAVKPKPKAKRPASRKKSSSKK